LAEAEESSDVLEPCLCGARCILLYERISEFANLVDAELLEETIAILREEQPFDGVAHLFQRFLVEIPGLAIRDVLLDRLPDGGNRDSDDSNLT
jgi:hypothetical protein